MQNRTLDNTCVLSSLGFWEGVLNFQDILHSAENPAQRKGVVKHHPLFLPRISVERGFDIPQIEEYLDSLEAPPFVGTSATG